MNPSKKPVMSRYVLLGGIALAGIFLFYLVILLNGLSYRQSTESTPKANLTLIAVPQLATVDLSMLYLTPTPTPDPTIQSLGGFAVGSFIQISGTGGNGLHIRNDPGVNSTINFVANESEVFKIIGGPVEMDNFVWMQITTPYDQTRFGWAVTEYMVPIEQQN
jgi:hypothetical protein